MPVALDAVMRGHLDHAAEVLTDEFGGLFSRGTISRFLEDSVDELAAKARVATYIPLLAERFARERLSALAQLEGKLTNDDPEGKSLDEVRSIRDEIDARVRQLLEELTAAREPGKT